MLNKKVGVYVYNMVACTLQFQRSSQKNKQSEVVIDLVCH